MSLSTYTFEFVSFYSFKSKSIKANPIALLKHTDVLTPDVLTHTRRAKRTPVYLDYIFLTKY